MKKIKINKGTSNALFVLMVALLVFMVFGPMFNVLGLSAAQEFATAIFGTIFAAVITMMLLNKQSQTQEEQEKNYKVFEQKIILFNDTLDKLEAIFELTDKNTIKMSPQNIIQIEFLLAKMIMISNEKTLQEFKSFYETITNRYSSETGILTLSAYDKQIIFRFADYCREELGLSNQNLSNSVLEDIAVQSELFYNLRDLSNYDLSTIKMAKNIYRILVFRLKISKRNFVFSENGFRVFREGTKESDELFLTCHIERKSVTLKFPEGVELIEISGTKLESKDKLLLKTSDKEKVRVDDDLVEKFIRQSYSME